MKKQIHFLPGLLCVGAVWLALALFCWFHPAQELSLSERRKLAQFPSPDVHSVLSGEFIPDFEEYTLDQFPFRDSFRTLKAVWTFYLFGQKDNNNIYIADGYAAELAYPLKEGSAAAAADKFTALYNRYMAGKVNRVYLSIVPDKGYFLAEANGYPSMDYRRLAEIMREGMPFASYVDITGHLALSDYYKTDTHWRQEKILDVANALVDAMGSDSAARGDYLEKTADIPFYGVYYGQSALPMAGESIRYLTNETLEACTAYHVETGQAAAVYDMEKLHSRDPYEVFLSGASPIVYLKNPNAASDRELLLFRDSFGSSLAPLLAEGYAKITLIDIRYIAGDYIGDYIDFDGQDVLFLYSSLILNNSTMLK